ncbi:MAG: response regulator, partial [Desulfobacteraceae bacterium]
MPGYRILVIEERPKERIAYTRLFESLGFFVDAVPDGIEATDLLFRNKPAMILAAMETPNVNAEELLEQI